MDQEKKEKIAVFRFGVIFPLIEKDLHQYWGEKERILRELVSREWEIPFSKRSFISKATLLSWVKRYEEGGRKIEALFPQARGDRGRRRCVDDDLLDAIIRFRKTNPKLSTPRLVEKAKAEGIIPGGKQISMASLYRLLKNHRLKREKAQIDRRKFEVQMSNDLWQSDCMHGPRILHEGRSRKSYLFALLDDHSRLITHGQFYLAESLENYLDCLWSALRKRGVPRKLYVDNGPSFRSHRLRLGTAALEIGLSYARPYKPQGKGKIERFFRTLRTQFLPELGEELSLDDLNARLAVYLDEVYHKRIHGGTGETPINRYLNDAKSLRQAPEDLPRYFRRQATRKVNPDRTVKLDGKVFEAPKGLIGLEVVLRYENHDRIEVFSGEQSKGFLMLLDQEVNSRVKRIGQNTEEKSISGGELFERFRKAGGE